MKKMILFQATIFIFLFSTPLSWGQQSVPEEAMRHFQRGIAAVEIAKTPEDYEKAIKEFEQAIIYAPSWAEAYYNLGLAQEKAERYKDAITSLKKYLQLSPYAPNAKTVKELIFRLEYKAEQVLSPDEIVDILVSLPEWQIVGDLSYCSHLINGFLGLHIKRVGPNLVRVLGSYEADRNPQKEFIILKVTGLILRWTMKIRNWSAPELISKYGIEGHSHEVEIEVLSRDRVIIREKMTPATRGPVKHFLCEYLKPQR